MIPWLDDGDVRLYHGDVTEVLSGLPDGSVDCVVASPPYWGLRDYGIDGQLGLEPTPDLYVQRMVEVFREVRRVLAAHGTCFVNLGDSYIAAQGGRQSGVGEMPAGTLQRTNEPREREDVDTGARANRDVTAKTTPARGTTSLKPKDLAGIPWRVAFALQADGWWLRADIIWAKPNPMPESVTDRPTKAHEYVFLLTKNSRYFFDQEAVREPAEWARWGDQTVPKHAGTETGAGWIKPKSKQELIGKRTYDGFNGRWDDSVADGTAPTGRNVRSVWTIATQPYPEAHFATYPEELVRRCVLAGCPERVCRVCGVPRTRLVDVSYEKSPVHGAGSVVGRHYETGANNFDGAGMPRVNKVTETKGWSHCAHSTRPENLRPGVVLDPFVGSGTTCKVARDHGRHSIGIDLSADYLKLAARRLQQLSLLT